MRTPISAMATLGGVLLTGACFDPTRSCSTNADCVNGGTCDPGTKTCVSAGNPNDKTPPTFSILVVPPSARQNTPKLTELDPASPDGGIDAFRRDEALTVLVTSQDQDVDAGSVKLRVLGVTTAPSTPLDAPLISCVPGAIGAASPFCRQATVSLAQVPFDAFRGVVTLEASGSDLSNNLGAVDAGVNVTRWKWRYSAGAPIYTTPAIADDGTIVFGTSDGGSGSLYALTPAGEEKWTPISVGPISASPAIGAGPADTSVIYAATAAAAGSKMYALRLLDGTDAGVCPSSTGAPFLAGLALVQTVSDHGLLESAVGLSGTNRLYTLRPRAQAPADSACIEAFVTVQTTATETIAADTTGLFIGAADNTARSFIFDETSRNWVKNPSWPSGTVVIGEGELAPLAISGSDVVATVRPDGLCKVAKGNGATTRVGPDGGIGSNPSGAALGGSSAFFTDTDLSSPRLWTFDQAHSVGVGAPIPGPARGVPVIGAGAVLYVAASSGFVEARSAGDTSWGSSLSSEGIAASITLDCARDGGVAVRSSSGTLYVATTAGSLHAVVVDSPGLDPSAPWPKYQHDVRNTGNPTTPIHSCP